MILDGYNIIHKHFNHSTKFFRCRLSAIDVILPKSAGMQPNKTRTMDFFDSEENVNQYIKMAEGFDGRELIKILKNHLPPGKTVLELGMGPGTDLDLLAGDFQVSGSDRSEIFVNRYLNQHPGADVRLLDAVTIATDDSFNCIYSNKVLHHLTRNELIQSIERQSEVLNPGGLVMHSFWRGDKEEIIEGMRFRYYLEQQLDKLFAQYFKILDIQQYTEMEAGDSIYLLGKARK